jgi:hypothetical protein
MPSRPGGSSARSARTRPVEPPPSRQPSSFPSHPRQPHPLGYHPKQLGALRSVGPGARQQPELERARGLLEVLQSEGARLLTQWMRDVRTTEQIFRGTTEGKSACAQARNDDAHFFKEEK